LHFWCWTGRRRATDRLGEFGCIDRSHGLAGNDWKAGVYHCIVLTYNQTRWDQELEAQEVRTTGDGLHFSMPALNFWLPHRLWKEDGPDGPA
jgi:hypothetical protein